MPSGAGGSADAGGGDGRGGADGSGNADGADGAGSSGGADGAGGADGVAQEASCRPSTVRRAAQRGHGDRRPEDLPLLSSPPTKTHRQKPTHKNLPTKPTHKNPPTHPASHIGNKGWYGKIKSRNQLQTATGDFYS